MYPGTHAQTQPDKPAIIHPASGITLSYRQLNEESNRLAHLLWQQGLRSGDHVALLMENHPAFLVVTWACLRSGLYLTPINRHLAAAEAAYIVDDCDARVLVASASLPQAAELGRLAQRCELKLALGGDIAGYQRCEPAMATQPAYNLPEEHCGTFMLYSSGTTGRPKGILRPLIPTDPAQGNPAMLAARRMFGMDTDTVYLAPAPLYHSAALGYCNAAIANGGTVVVMDRFDAETALQLIERYRITHGQWVPTMFIRLLKLPPQVRARHDLSSLRCAIHASAPCPVEVKRQMIEWWGPILEEYYSSTEAVGFARISSSEWLQHPGSVGRSVSKPFHICDEDGIELPPGTPGVIYAEMSADNAISYHKDRDKTVSALHPRHPHWLAVGDIGYLDEEGYLYLTDRKAFLIISGGVNIYPQQIEDALALHPKLDDVAVVGVPNADLGEEARAVIQLAPGVDPSAGLASELQAWVGERLGKQLIPRSVEFVRELPRTPTGKLNKKELRAHYWPQSH